MTQQVDINLSKTKLYVLYEALGRAVKADPSNVSKEMEALEEEIMRITTAHSLFVFSIRNSYLAMNKVGIEKDVTPVFKEQLDVVNNLVKKIIYLNNYYYGNESSNQKGVDEKDKEES
jgi:hypothetical protein